MHVYCKGRVSGDTLLRSNQKTDINGDYQFGLWAGNRNTDSTYYWIIAEKAGYVTDTVRFWIKRNDTTTVPSLSLCPGITGTKDNLVVYPNPSSGHFAIEAEEGTAMGSNIEVYDLMGQRVYQGAQTGVFTDIDIAGQADGLYILVLRNSGKIIDRKRILIVH